VAVAVDEHDRSVEGADLIFECRLELCEAGGRGGVFLEGVGLDHEHHPGAAHRLRLLERLGQPLQVGGVAGLVYFHGEAGGSELSRFGGANQISNRAYSATSAGAIDTN
jgi:hypothetical protein